MAKTITVRIDDPVYEMFKKAAAGQKRTISNYIEYATLSYIANESVVDDHEMDEILSFEKDINNGIADISAGRYTVIG